ncbi:hypothetical protein ACFLTP_04220 [Chloroflexota bacterium]
MYKFELYYFFNLGTLNDVYGYYSFSVAPGNYAMSETLQTGWTQSYPAPPGTYDITLTSNQEDMDNYFGNFCNATKAGLYNLL